MTGAVGPPLSGTPRTRLRRGREKARGRREALLDVLAAGFVCHLGVVVEGVVMVVPTVYGYDPDTLYLHGSVASRSLAGPPDEVCVTVTVLDGVVLARSVFEHSVNYRSAMIYGRPGDVTDDTERLAALRLITEHVAPGQWDYARQPNRRELAATRLWALSLGEASVKVRSGGPDDADSADARDGRWAGELPVLTGFGTPVPDPALPVGTPVPRHVADLPGTWPGRG
ncbi:pyridoxamine 5'-phosphate oxidase family protein [Salinispora arenicola]|uniref:pyridoxamine 5'-phosphate oxidase family protein n=1 Tax=Salinispora arenicola TaxID=168697 RepID=UPI00207942EA|nr:pyridoxamine 5'-phosphate oxidase family protein [Salinispora arenicola]MCN0176830.1 pyridoxamine 5'-phosphate oxidase family protein [Salinispora arenicola]